MKHILISGASTGIGYDACRYLIEKGFYVFGTVRKNSDKERLIKEFPNNFEAILLDVVSDESILNMADYLQVKLIDTGLYGLVNNAGIALGGPIIHVSSEEMDLQMQTNFNSVFKITNALSELLGAGKSTIASLLLRLYEPNSGSIVFDKLKSSDIPLSQLREQIALVPQDTFLFGGTIRENIAYGKTTATEEEIIIAAKKANAWEFIERFPDRMETIVGERGTQLSGGQRQRISIARAILKSPKILILDEATSSLDSASEKMVQEAMEKLMNDRTSVVIAHRLSTVKKADLILVLDQGKLVEQGTHESLKTIEEGLYNKLRKLQEF